MDLFQTCNTVVFWNQGIPKKVLTVWDSFGGQTKSCHVKWKLGILSLSCSQYSQTICRHHRQMIPTLGREHYHGKTQYITEPGPGEVMTVEEFFFKVVHEILDFQKL